MLQILILMVLLLVVPVAVGGLFAGIHEGSGGILFRWVSGQMCLWAGFQLICVPFILREKNFSDVLPPFIIYMVAVMLLAAGIDLKRAMRTRHFIGLHWQGSTNVSLTFLWCFAAGLLLLQLVSACFMAYADGDDAYYVAVSAITVDADTMYKKLPYTGFTTGLDMRHAIAPFPMWIAFLAKVSGMQTVTVAQVVLPVVLISMTYGIFYLIAVRLFPKKDSKRPLFLIFTELLVLFGDYSIYTVENFMIARSRQGKAAIGSIVIPFIILLLLILMIKLQNKERIPRNLYLLLGAAIVTGCLCSTLSALLCGMLVGIVGLLGSFCYKKPGMLLPLAVCCIPCICYGMLYMILE